jgi:hypothetical protein
MCSCSQQDFSPQQMTLQNSRLISILTGNGLWRDCIHPILLQVKGHSVWMWSLIHCAITQNWRRARHTHTHRGTRALTHTHTDTRAYTNTTHAHTSLGLRRATCAKLEASHATVNQPKLMKITKPGSSKILNFDWRVSRNFAGSFLTCATPNFNFTDMYQVAEFTPKTTVSALDNHWSATPCFCFSLICAVSPL